MAFKKHAVERKTVKRKHQRERRDAITQGYHAQDATNILAEGQSLSTYKRMRMAESFETPEQKKNIGCSALQNQENTHCPLITPPGTRRVY